MSPTIPPTTADEIRVLLVDDDSELAELTGIYLHRENDAFTVLTEATAEDGLDRLAAEDIDCIISDYTMPGLDGIAFLEHVRDEWPALPFILFTGRGSEEVASDAISAGVTDYLQKQGGTDQYTVLANRVENAVAQRQAEQEIRDTTRWYSTILEHSSDYIMIIDEMGDVSYVSPAIERVLGYDVDKVLGTNAFDFVHPDDTQPAATTIAEIIQHPESEESTEFRAKHTDGSWRWLETRGRNLLADPVINGIMVNVRDITARKERKQALERERDRLQNLSRFMSHDVRNQLNVIDGRLEMAQAEVDSDHLAPAVDAVERIDEMIAEIMVLADGSQREPETQALDLATAAENCWTDVMPDDADLVIESTRRLEGEPQQVRRLLENLFVNAVDHVGPAVTIRIGSLADTAGFYVADDGSGIPAAVADQVFEPGVSTAQGDSGLGLAIVKEIADTHGWAVAVADSASGGARFEFLVAAD